MMPSTFYDKDIGGHDERVDKALTLLKKKKEVFLGSNFSPSKNFGIILTNESYTYNSGIKLHQFAWILMPCPETIVPRGIYCFG